MITNTAIKWCPEFTIGHNKIDKQHEYLFQLLANIQHQVHKPNHQDLIKQSLRDLFDYTQRHFKDEEQLMREVGYPDLTIHSIQHDNLLNQVEDMIDNLNDSNPIAIDKLILFLVDWLTEHILGEDLVLARYLNKTNLNITTTG